LVLAVLAGSLSSAAAHERGPLSWPETYERMLANYRQLSAELQTLRTLWKRREIQTQDYESALQRLNAQLQTLLLQLDDSRSLGQLQARQISALQSLLDDLLLQLSAARRSSQRSVETAEDLQSDVDALVWTAGAGWATSIVLLLLLLFT
jgi:Skp family chaperone for outer membrane proteins